MKNKQMKRAVESMMTPDQIKIARADRKLRAVNQEADSSDSESSAGENTGRGELFQSVNLRNYTDITLLKGISQGAVKKELKLRRRILLNTAAHGSVATEESNHSNPMRKKSSGLVMGSGILKNRNDSLNFNETGRNLIDDKSSAQDGSMYGTLTKLDDNSILN